VAAAARELFWGLRAVAKEVDTLRARAAVIPDAKIRGDALGALARKRPHLDGAALFWILPRHRNLRLLRLLVTYELILEFLDNMNERAAHAGLANGRQLHLALVEALDPDAPISDYYRYHPWRDDGGYLQALVETCRELCMALVSYPRVRQLAIREAFRAQVLALNHEPDPCCRDVALRDWVEQEFPGEAQANWFERGFPGEAQANWFERGFPGEAQANWFEQGFPDKAQTNWFELSGAATAPLTVHMLLALAAEPIRSEDDISDACAVYFPGLSLIATMLDSYVDQAQDSASNNHSYIAHYPTSEHARRRICELIAQSIHEARRLRDGHRHVVLAACMIAMYLSNDSALEPKRSQASMELACTGGRCTRLLLPILRIWRMAYALRSA
jgi:tetraprenyl-beta-curcumene synthase